MPQGARRVPQHAVQGERCALRPAPAPGGGVQLQTKTLRLLQQDDRPVRYGREWQLRVSGNALQEAVVVNDAIVIVFIMLHIWAT